MERRARFVLASNAKEYIAVYQRCIDVTVRSRQLNAKMSGGMQSKAKRLRHIPPYLNLLERSTLELDAKIGTLDAEIFFSILYDSYIFPLQVTKIIRSLILT